MSVFPYGKLRSYVKSSGMKRMPYATKKTTVIEVARKRGRKGKGKAVKAMKRNLFASVNDISFLPVAKWARLMFNARGVVTTGTTSLAGGYVYSLNGMWKPDVTTPAVVHKPLGFTSPGMLFYEHYTVSYAKASIRFYNKTTGPICVGYYINPDATVLTDPTQIHENGLAQSKWIENTTGGGVASAINFSISMNKYFGKKIINEDDYRGDTLSNPTEQVYLVLFAYSPDATNPTQGIPFEIDLEYTAKFTEPRKLLPQ